MQLQETSQEIWEKKYCLKDNKGDKVDQDIDDTFKRVAWKLSETEQDQEYWYERFLESLRSGATPGGRIISNAGTGEYKPETSLINCTVSSDIKDSMDGILESVKQAGITLKSGAGIGYSFSFLRPKGSFVNGAGAETSGPISFMTIFDSMCSTVSSAGGRRGAQMSTFDVWHPDIEEFIETKQQNGMLRKFNLSVLVTEQFMEAVKNNDQYPLVFPLLPKEEQEQEETMWMDLPWKVDYCKEHGYTLSEDESQILMKVYRWINAKDLWNKIMQSTYDYAEPGIIFVDRINQENNNWFCEGIRATNPCGEVPLPENGSCLLGSINIANFVKEPFTPNAHIDWESYRETIRIFTRMLDNVVEFNGLPVQEQREELERKRRHGMGIMGLGSAFSLLGIEYGSQQSLELTDQIMEALAVTGIEEGIELAKEKGPAPIFEEDPKNIVKWCESQYLQRVWDKKPELKQQALEHGCRFTHHTAVAPTGTIALSINNNVSNGIEPTFSHKYTRNLVEEGRKTKRAVDVYSYEMLLWYHLTGEEEVPEWFSTTDNVEIFDHVNVQARVQKWVDASVSKTVNVPTETSFEDFKDIYLYGYEQGLKGLTTFRFNPEVFQGVLVKDEDLENTEYVFVTDQGERFVAKGNQTIQYDGEEHTAANLYESIKENTYG